MILRQWPVYAEVALAAVLINLFALASPLFIMNVYDRVVPNNAVETLWVLAIGVLVVFGFDFLLKVLRGYFVDVAGRVADVKLASAVFAQVMGLQLAARPASAGAFANDLREFESLRDFFSSASITALVDLPFLLLFVGRHLADRRLGGAGAGGRRAAGAGRRPAAPGAARPRGRAPACDEAAQKHGVLVEAINGLETIKSVGAEGRAQGAWERLVGGGARVRRRLAVLGRARRPTSPSLAANLVTVGVVIVGRARDRRRPADHGRAGRLQHPRRPRHGAAGPGRGACSAATTRRARRWASLDRVMRLPVERAAGPALPAPAAARRARSSSSTSRFTYPRQNLPALADVSFQIAAGERVGLVGRVGSGKTTVEKLLLGLYQPDSGAVLVDGTELRQIDPADLRRNVGCVPQDLYLFQGTLRENIAMGAPHADDEAVLRAARARRAWTTSPAATRWATTWSWASAARRSPAASGRRSRSPARSCSSRRSWCSTSRPASWTTPPRAASRPGSRPSSTAARCC